MLVCSLLSAIRTRDRGCSAHPVFPAPSVFEGGKFNSKPWAEPRREIAKVCWLFEMESENSSVVAANAGTHNHRPRLFYEVVVNSSLPTTTAAAYGSLRSQGRQHRCEIRGRPHTFGRTAPRDRETASVL